MKTNGLDFEKTVYLPLAFSSKTVSKQIKSSWEAIRKKIEEIENREGTSCKKKMNREYKALKNEKEIID